MTSAAAAVAAHTSDPDHPRATIYRQSGMTPPFVEVKMANTRDLAVFSLCPRSCDSSHYAHIGSLTLGGACQCSLITPSSVQRVTLQVCFYFTSPAAAFLMFSNCENILVLKWLKDFSKKYPIHYTRIKLPSFVFLINYLSYVVCLFLNHICLCIFHSKSNPNSPVVGY